MSDWEVVKAKKTGIDLNQILTPEFLKLINEEYENKNISLINLGFVITDKDINPEENEGIGLINLSNESFEDTLNKSVTISTNQSENYEKFKSILNKFSSD